MKAMKLVLPIFILLLSGQYLNAQDNIHDADNNTKVETERTANNDLIYFKTGGTDRWRMIGSRLEPQNTGNSIFLGVNAGRNDDLTNNQNVFLGTAAGDQNTSGFRNFGLGYTALRYNISGYDNVAIGSNSLNANTTGYWNTGIGSFSLQLNTTGQRNTGIGLSSFYKLAAGNDNTGIGPGSMFNTTSGSNNTSVGALAGYYVTSGSNNTFIGQKAGYVGSNHSKSGSVFIGYEAGYNETNSNRLYVANSNTTNPLIFGNFSSNQIGFGTTSPTARVHINSGVGQDALRVQVNSSTQMRVFSNGSMSIGSNSSGAAGQLRVTYASSRFNNNVGVGVDPDESMVKILGEVANTSPVLYSEVSNTNTQTKAIQGKALAAPGKGYGGHFQGGYMSVYGRTSGGDAPNTSYGGYLYNANTGNNAKYGLYTNVSNSTGTGAHYGLYSSVSGAGTKYSGYFNGGKVFVNSNSSAGEGNLVLRETQAADYTRLTMKDASGTDYWDIAAKANGINSVMNLYYHNGTTGTNVLSLDGDKKYAGVNGAPSYTFDVNHNSGTPGATGGNGLNIENSSSGENWTFYTFSGGDFKLYRNGLLRGSFNKTSGAYVSVSDRKLKKEIKTLENQMDKIMQLKPSTYLFKGQRGIVKNYGFVAQDVQKVFPELAPIVETVEEGASQELRGVSYTEFVPVLVAGMQEQQTIISQQGEKIAQLEAKLDKIANLDATLAKIDALDAKLAKLDEMSERLDQFSNDLQYCCSNNAQGSIHTVPVKMEKVGEMPFVEQNMPNPFTAQTEIKYYIPKNAQGGVMQITDRSGKVLKTVTIQETGAGKVVLDANELMVGLYYYTFIVDGKIIDTMQMVLTK